MTLSLTFWDQNQNPTTSTFEAVMDAIYNDDMQQGLIKDPATMDALLEESEPLALDGIVTPFAKLEIKMRQMQRVMNATGGELSVVSFQLSDPFMRNGVANVAGLFELSDGQTVSVFFHNPDTTPKKITPDDIVTSWKWLLNKKDVSVVVAPERGKEIDVRQVAMRIMKIAAKNSKAFQRLNAKRAERLARIAELEKIVPQKEQELKTKLAKIEELERLISDLETDKRLNSANNVKNENKPIVLTGNELGDFDTTTEEGKKALREAAFDRLVQLAENGETVFCSALNANVGFTKKGAKKFKSLSGNPVKSKIVAKIKEIIANGKVFKPSEERYDNTEYNNKMTYHYLKSAVSVDEEEYGARVVVREDANGNFHYDLQIVDNVGIITDSVNKSTDDLLLATNQGLPIGAYSSPTANVTDNTLFLDDVQGENGVNEKAVRSYEANKSSVSNRQQGLTLDRANDTLFLDDTSSGYVLNLFVYDKDGNLIDDEIEQPDSENKSAESDYVEFKPDGGEYLLYGKDKAGHEQLLFKVENKEQFEMLKKFHAEKIAENFTDLREKFYQKGVFEKPDFLGATVGIKAQENKEIVTLTGNELGDFDTTTEEGKKALREAAFEHLVQLAENGETVFCKAVNADVGFNKAGAKKFKSLGANPVKNQIAAMIKDVIRNATLVKANVESYDADEKVRGITYSIIKTAVTVKGQEYGVRTVLRKLENGQYQYDMQVKKSVDMIVDNTNENGLWAARLTKSDVPQSAPYQELTLDDDDNTLTLDDVSSGYVLNLFVYDKDGNLIDDEEGMVEAEANKKLSDEEIMKAYKSHLLSSDMKWLGDNHKQLVTIFGKRVEAVREALFKYGFKDDGFSRVEIHNRKHPEYTMIHIDGLDLGFFVTYNFDPLKGNVQDLLEKSPEELAEKIIETYERAIGKRPATETDEQIVLTGGEFSNANLDLSIKENKEALRNEVRDYLENLIGKTEKGKEPKGKIVRNIALDRDVLLSTRGVNEMLNWSADPRKLKAMAAIVDIVRTAKPEKGVNPKQDNEKKGSKSFALAYYHLKAKVNIAGEELPPIRVIFEEDDKGLLHYDFIIPKEKVALDSVRTSPHDTKPWNELTGNATYGTNNTLILDNAQGGYVLNLFFLDENGNVINDVDDNDVTEMGKSSKENDLIVLGIDYGKLIDKWVENGVLENDDYWINETKESVKKLKETGISGSYLVQPIYNLVNDLNNGNTLYLAAALAKCSAPDFQTSVIHQFDFPFTVNGRDIIGDLKMEIYYLYQKATGKSLYELKEIAESVYRENREIAEERERQERQAREEQEQYKEQVKQAEFDRLNELLFGYLDEFSAMKQGKIISNLFYEDYKGEKQPNDRVRVANEISQSETRPYIKNEKVDSSYKSRDLSIVERSSQKDFLYFTKNGEELSYRLQGKNSLGKIAADFAIWLWDKKHIQGNTMDKQAQEQADIQFLNDVIEGKIDVLSDDFYPKFEEICHQLFGEYPDLVDQAVNAYIVKVDAYAQEGE